MLQDGCHMIPHDLQQYSHEELQLMKTQDEKYIHMKLATEGKVSTCHCLGENSYYNRHFRK